MEVILLEAKKKLGNIGDVVNVANGYARNYLIPNNIVASATKKNREIFEKRKENIEEQNKKNLENAIALAKEIAGKDINIISLAAEDNKLYGSISKKSLAKILTKEHNINIGYDNIILNEAIKSIGVYEIPLQLHHEVKTSIILNVAKSEKEAELALKSFLSNKNEPVADQSKQQDNN